MNLLSVSEFAAQRGVPERTVRNYCVAGKIAGAFQTGRTWNIPEDAALPQKGKQKRREMPLLRTLREQKEMQLRGGIYHKLQIELTYNSNHIEGSRLTHDQTRYIFETNTIDVTSEAVNVDDIIETANHFRCIDIIIERATERLSESLIKELHRTLKQGTADSRRAWFNVGEYKRLPNEVGGHETTPPEAVRSEMQALLKDYNSASANEADNLKRSVNSQKHRTLDEILDFHSRFERIHPFQDGNGRVGRLIMFKECLAAGIIPFIITDDLKLFYYRGLAEWPRIPGYLRDTCLTAQDRFRVIMQQFKVI